MRRIGVKELKQNASRVLQEVERDGPQLVTVAGRPVATLTPLEPETRWVPTSRLHDVFAARSSADTEEWLDEVRAHRRSDPAPIDPFTVLG